MTSIIQTAVLRAAVLSAFDRGRYSVTFSTAPAGDDLAVVPSAIILNLEEQDDDLLGSERFELFTEAEERELRREVREAFGADDHGPAVPAQDGPRVYEFALQDAVAYNSFIPVQLDAATQNHAPDYVAASNADWVHVYDRMTRERRTLKRPTEDKIVKGLADVAADLRAKPVPMPAHGPLTSAEGLMRGDVLRIIQCGTILRFDAVIPEGETWAGRFTTYLGGHDGEPNAIFPIHQLAFVGRPDAEGWMGWPGGENPVGEAMVEYLMADAGYGRSFRASGLRWSWPMEWPRGGDIVRFRLVDMPSLPSDT